MNIQRINTYHDPRFSQTVLNQHGCFLAGEDPYEVEIVSNRAAVIRGKEEATFPAVIEEFRFYAPHITRFYNETGALVANYPSSPVLTLSLGDIQPSQFYVDEEKLAAIRSFVHAPEDIVISVLRHKNRYISLDGHTRLYHAAVMGWRQVRAVEDAAGSYIYGFVEEALRRNIRTPYDLRLIGHQEYEKKWHQFCDNYFRSLKETRS